MIINIKNYPDNGWYKSTTINLKNEKPINDFKELKELKDIPKGSLVIEKGNNKLHQAYDFLELSDYGKYMSENSGKVMETIDVDYTIKTIYSHTGETIDLKVFNNDAKKTYVQDGFGVNDLSDTTFSFISKEAAEYKKYLTFETYNHEHRDEAAYSDESYFTNELVKKYTGQAREVLEFFSEEKPSNNETKNLATEMVNLIKQLGKQMAKDEGKSTRDLQKITVKGVKISFDELKTGIMAMKNIGKKYSRNVYDFVDPSNSAVAGIAYAKMKGITNNMSNEASEIFLNKYNKTMSNYFNEHDERIKLSQNFRKKLHKELETSIGHKFTNRNDTAVNEYYHLDAPFEGSGKQDIYTWFSNIDSSSEGSFKKGFENAIKKYKDFHSDWSKERGYPLRENELRIDELYNAYKIELL